MAVLVGISESVLRVSIATEYGRTRRLLEPLPRLVLVSQQAQVAKLVGASESAMRVFIATLRRLLEPHERHLDVDLGT